MIRLVYIMPSVSEPFGISPLEAMSVGGVVILSNQSGCSELLCNVLCCDYWEIHYTWQRYGRKMNNAN